MPCGRWTPAFPKPTPAYDAARIHLEGVQGTGLGTTLTIVGNGVGGTYFVAAYGPSPLVGSGALIKVIYTAITTVDIMKVVPSRGFMPLVNI